MSDKVANPYNPDGAKITFYDSLNDLRSLSNLDVYVTGSNSKMLSSDILTEFRGRSDEIRVHPLSFAEYYSAVGGDKIEAFDEYAFYGGMPLILSRPTDAAKRWYDDKGILNVNVIDFLLDNVKMDAIPGTKPLYKEWDVIILSAIISSASGMNTFDFCNEYLYKPLGIESGRWWTHPCGICYNIGPNPAEQAKSDLSARDLAKIGFLFKQGGIYKGERIISGKYIFETLTPNDLYHGHILMKQSYGYMWWIYNDGYGCSGYGGQQIKVMPEKNIVYVIQATALNTHRDYSDAVDEAILSNNLITGIIY